MARWIKQAATGTGTRQAKDRKVQDIVEGIIAEVAEGLQTATAIQNAEQ